MSITEFTTGFSIAYQPKERRHADAPSRGFFVLPPAATLIFPVFSLPAAKNQSCFFAFPAVPRRSSMAFTTDRSTFTRA